MALITRLGKGAPLTFTEMDANLTGLANGSNLTAPITIAAPVSGNTLTIGSLVGQALVLNTQANATVFTINDGTCQWQHFTAGASGVTQGTITNHPWTLNTNNLNRIVVAAAGNVTIQAPTSGTSLTVNGASGGIGLSITTTGANYTATFEQGTTADSQVRINAPTSFSPVLDLAISATVKAYLGVSGSAGAYVSGDGAGDAFFRCDSGAINFSLSGGAAAMKIASSGVVTIAPNSGTAFTVGDGTNARTVAVLGDMFFGVGNTFVSGAAEMWSGVQMDIGTNAAQSVNLFTNSSNRLTISSAGAVSFPSISTTASAANAFLDSAANNNLLRSTSSLRYKTNVKDLSDENDTLSRLRPVTFTSTSEADDPEIIHLGFIAEEVAEVDPRLVTIVDGRPNWVQYERIGVLLVAEIQKLRTRVARLEQGD